MFIKKGKIMNKNRLLNLIFFVFNISYIIFLVFNFIFNLLDLYILLSIFLFLNSIYLLIKFYAYNSDSSLFLASFLLFNSIFVLIAYFYNLSLLKLGSLIFLSSIFGFLFLALRFKSVTWLFTFLSNILIFFPIFFITFEIIDLKLFFIFLTCCVIINVALFLILFKRDKV